MGFMMGYMLLFIEGRGRVRVYATFPSVNFLCVVFSCNGCFSFSSHIKM